jgi:hypothetical protein
VVAGILFFILYRQIIFLEYLAGTKCLAGMFETRFRAGTKIHWSPVYYFFILYRQMQIYRSPVQKQKIVPVSAAAFS